MNFDFNTMMNLMTMMKTFMPGKPCGDTEYNNADGKGFNLDALSLLPLIMGMKNGGTDISNMLGALAGLRGEKQQCNRNAQDTVSSQNFMREDEKESAAKNSKYRPDFCTRISFAGDEVVYFLQKMRILSAK